MERKIQEKRCVCYEIQANYITSQRGSPPVAPDGLDELKLVEVGRGLLLSQAQ